jgi:hypothetical protein
MKYFFLAAIIVLVLKTLDLIYFFQIKEYRFDRFFSGIKEQGTSAVLYNPVIHLPAKKLRNFLIFLPILIFLVVFAYFFRPSILTTLIILMLSPIIGFLLTAFFVSLTGIPVYFYRKKIINDAKKKIAGSKAVFIGITGSYGKTSAKEMLYDILKNKYKVAKTDANMNSDIGIALSVIKNLKDDTHILSPSWEPIKERDKKSRRDRSSYNSRHHRDRQSTSQSFRKQKKPCPRQKGTAFVFAEKRTDILKQGYR